MKYLENEISNSTPHKKKTNKKKIEKDAKIIQLQKHQF